MSGRECAATACWSEPPSLSNAGRAGAQNHYQHGGNSHQPGVAQAPGRATSGGLDDGAPVVLQAQPHRDEFDVQLPRLADVVQAAFRCVDGCAPGQQWQLDRGRLSVR